MACLAAYRATDGKQLWSFDAGTGIMAPPVTYQIDGVQYVSVLAGWGGPDGLGNDPSWGHVKPGYGRILTFMIGGNATLKAPAFGHKNPPPVPTVAASTSPQVIHEGELLFADNCSGCHGAKAIAGPLPDLRYASKADAGRHRRHRAWRKARGNGHAVLPENPQCRASARHPGLYRFACA